MCAPMFITGLFTIATCRQPKYLSTGELMKNMWCVCVCVCMHIRHKKEWNNAICSNMDRPRNYHTKCQRQIVYDIAYVWNLKSSTNDPVYKAETDSDMEKKLTITKWEGEVEG